jgi:hypothetical protein
MASTSTKAGALSVDLTKTGAFRLSEHWRDSDGNLNGRSMLAYARAYCRKHGEAGVYYGSGKFLHLWQDGVKVRRKTYRPEQVSVTDAAEPIATAALSQPAVTRALDAVGQICEMAMHVFATASHRGELAKAKARLGTEFAIVGAEALRRHIKRALIKEREEREQELSVPGLGGMAAQAMLADIVGSAAADVIAAAA